jgi:deoxyribodipyrimidine photo-lyase
LGADFFLRHLLDGDPASNTLGWRWVAGLQTVGKTYLARADNIASFTEGRFNPVGHLAPDAPPLPPLPLPEPQPLAELPTLDPSKRSGFLLHGEDLNPGFALEGLDPVAFCRIAPPEALNPLSRSPLAVRFHEDALADAADRWADRMGTDHGTVRTAQDIADWAGKAQLEQIVAPYAPVGPVADLLRTFETLPGTPPLVRVRRRYDSTCWPYATKGFFAFKRQIPDFLKSLI